MDTKALGWPTWIGVVVDDLPAARRFYEDAFGLEDSGRGAGWVHFEFGDNLFELIQRDGSPQYGKRRYQVGFTVDDIEAARDRLLSVGAEQISEIEGGSETRNRWCYFRDPEGNVFEVTQWVRP